jgi:N-methylhydantoinase A
MTASTHGTRVAVDVGGTFTDVVSLDPVAGVLRVDKVETTPSDPAAGVLHALAKIGAPPSTVAYFVHGTTLALNALLTRTGAKVAIVTTAGFRDIFELGRTDREPMYDLTYRKPAPLVPRSLAFEVGERMTWNGTVLRPVDEASVVAVAAQLRASGVDSVAVSLLHSYANPTHELEVGAILSRELPGCDVTLSHQLLREYREYERTSTAVLDAYVKPVVRAYLARLEGELAGQGFVGRFLMTRSGGGTMTVEAAKERPVNLVLSGPAGGVIGAAAFAELIGEPNVITLDMGGTSLDASIIVDGQPVLTRDARFQGLPVSLPALDINTIGAGGGSIAWLDDGNHLQVGPRSAGADPGPAAYGRGGTNATVTDAALVLGYLGTDTALGGELRLDRGLAQAALGPLAAAMGLSPEAVAAGILRITTTRVTGAVREITVERGHVPGDFALFSFGGGGGLIAADVARELGVPRVVVPPGPGAFCALGMLFADVVHDAARTWVLTLSGVDTAALDAAYQELEAGVIAGLATDGFADDDRALTRSADLRYQGQEHSVSIALPPGRMDAEAVSALTEAFGVAHLTLYGHRVNDPIELVTLRVRGIGRVPRPELPRIAGPAGGGAAHDGIVGTRRVNGAGGPHDYKIVSRSSLTAGSVVTGPAIVEEHTATTVLHPGDVGRVGTYGELDITIAPGVAHHG